MFRIMTKPVAAMLLLAIASASAYAKNCNLLLQDGLHTYQGQFLSYYQFQRAQSFFQQDDAGTFDQAKNDATNLGIDIVDIAKLSFGDSNNDKDYQTWKRDFIAATYDMYLEHGNFQSVVVAFDDQLAKAFDKCKDEDDGGVHLWIDTKTDVDFIFQLQFREPPNSGIASVKITSISPTHATCTGINQLVGKQLTSSAVNVSCHKDKAEDTAYVTVNTDNFSPTQTPSFPEFQPPKIPPNQYTLSGQMQWLALPITQIGTQMFIAGVVEPWRSQLIALNNGSGGAFKWPADADYAIPAGAILQPGASIAEFDPTVCKTDGTAISQQGSNIHIHVDSECQIQTWIFGFGSIE